MNTALNTARTAAVVTGAAYAALGVTSLTGTVPDERWGLRGTVVDLLGLVGFAVNVLAVERLREPLHLGPAGRVALRTAQLGLAAMTVESAVSLVHGGNTLGVVFLVGLLVTLVSFLVVAIVGLRRPSTRWVAPLPFVALVIGVGAGDHGGFLLPGLVWLVLGVASLGTPELPPSSRARSVAT